MVDDKNELPLYKCHKKVRAAQIIDICHRATGVTELKLSCGDLRRVSASWVRKHSPSILGYYVEYDDSYTSFSSQKAFENGYTLWEDVE